MNKFWIVMKHAHETYVGHRHTSLESAEVEAERLCKKENKVFIVLEAIEMVGPVFPVVEIKWEGMEPAVEADQLDEETR